MRTTRRHLLRATALATTASACASSPRARPPAAERDAWREAALALVPDDGPLPSFTAADYAARRRRAQERMAANDVDALILTPSPDLAYFTGVRWHLSERFFAFVLPRDGAGFFITPAFEAGRAEERAGASAVLHVWQENEDPFALVKEHVKKHMPAARVALDGMCPLVFRDRLAAALEGSALFAATLVTAPLRMRKDDKELALMRRANQVTLTALRTAFAHLEEGLDQATLGARLEEAQRAQGGAGVWVLPLIGESAAFPHGTENPRALARGDVVLVDTGCSIGGYQSDLTRTVFFGSPPDDVARAWQLVKRAQEEALAHVRPGVAAGEVDAIARRVITDGGFGPGYRFFTHRTGHGIGLLGHEPPYFVEGNERVLEPGMTLSCEPGIYVPGRFGIRIEDILVVTDDGAELLGPPQRGPAPALV